jgi:hypothetical protein
LIKIQIDIHLVKKLKIQIKESLIEKK